LSVAVVSKEEFEIMPADTAAAAVRALEWDALVPIEKLDVTISKGWVTLRGDVEWHYQKVDAERVVRRSPA
jgi:osmotically-inducible protein OsmY